MGERNLLVKLLGDASNLNKAFKEAGGGADGLGGAFGKMKGKLAAALSIGAVAAFAGDTVKAFESVAQATGKLQRLTGGTAEDMSRLSFEAKESGVSQELLEKSLTKLSKTMDGNSSAFKDLGVSTKDAQGNLRPMGDVMLDLSEKFKEMPNGAEKNALAMKLFGKSGTDLLPMLNRGKDALAEFGKESDQFGLTIGQGSVDAYKKHVAESRKMHAAMEGLKVQIGEKLAPVFYKFASFMAINLPKAITFVKGVFESLKPTFEAIGEWIATLVEWWKAHWDEIRLKVENVIGYISGFISGGLAVIEAFWRTFGDNVLGFIQGWVDGLVAVFQGLWDVIVGIFDLFRDIFTGKWGKLWGDVKDIFTGIWTIISGAFQAVVDEIAAILGAAWTVISSAIQIAWEGIKTVVSGAIDGIVGFVTGIPGRITATVSALWDDIKTGISSAKNWVSDRIDEVVGFATGLPSRMIGVFSGMWDGIKTSFKAVINTIIGWWNDLDFTFPGYDIPGPGPNIPGFTIGLPDIPKLHTGGMIPGLAGQEVLVVARAGERIQTQGQANADRGSQAGDTFVFNGVTDPRAISSLISREQGWKLRAA